MTVLADALRQLQREANDQAKQAIETRSFEAVAAAPLALDRRSLEPMPFEGMPLEVSGFGAAAFVGPESLRPSAPKPLPTQPVFTPAAIEAAEEVEEFASPTVDLAEIELEELVAKDWFDSSAFEPETELELVKGPETEPEAIAEPALPFAAEPATLPFNSSSTDSSEADEQRPAVGDVLLAYDLASDTQLANEAAAALAIEGAARLTDEVLYLRITPPAGHRETSSFPQATAEPGVFSADLPLAGVLTELREVLVLLDEYRQRFARIVLVLDPTSHQAVDSLLRLLAPRMDRTVVLATPGRTPRAMILRAEARLRTAGATTRPQLLMAA